MAKYYLLLMFSIAFCAEAQTISSAAISSGGSTLLNSTGSLSITIGQSLAGNITTGAITLHQGFQVNLSSSTTVTAIFDDMVMLEIFPNPTTQHLFIKGAPEFSTYSFELIDLTGKPLAVDQQRTDDSVELNLQELTPAIYILRIQQLNRPTQTISIMKSN